MPMLEKPSKASIKSHYAPVTNTLFFQTEVLSQLICRFQDVDIKSVIFQNRHLLVKAKWIHSYRQSIICLARRMSVKWLKYISKLQCRMSSSIYSRLCKCIFLLIKGRNHWHRTCFTEICILLFSDSGSFNTLVLCIVYVYFI